MKTTATFTRSKTAAGVLSKLKAKIDRNAKAAVVVGAEIVFDRSLDLVPVDTGALRRSAYFSQTAEVEVNLIYAKIGYGKSSSQELRVWSKKSNKFVERRPYTYSKKVHDEIARQDGERGTDYLKRAVLEKAPDVARRIIEIMKRS